MNQDIYEQIKVMRSSMEIWISYAEEIVAGAPVEKKHEPVKPAQCEFGKWYHNLRPFLNDLQAYQRIIVHHENQHVLYSRIYNLICPYGNCGISCPSSDCSTVSKISGKAAKKSEQRRIEASELIPTLRVLNEQLQQMLDLLEEEIRKADKAPAERLAKLSSKRKNPKKNAEVNRMLDTLNLKIEG